MKINRTKIWQLFKSKQTKDYFIYNQEEFWEKLCIRYAKTRKNLFDLLRMLEKLEKG